MAAPSGSAAYLPLEWNADLEDGANSDIGETGVDKPAPPFHARHEAAGAGCNRRCRNRVKDIITEHERQVKAFKEEADRLREEIKRLENLLHPPKKTERVSCSPSQAPLSSRTSRLTAGTIFRLGPILLGREHSRMRSYTSSVVRRKTLTIQSSTPHSAS